MKAIKCSMCGSVDLIKQGDYYICQNCGTKYSDEDIKRIIVSGKIKVDNSEIVENRYLLARQAIVNGEYKEACKYYGLIRETVPSDWEAMFFSVYADAMQSNINGIENAAFRIGKIAVTAIKAISSDISDASEAEKACREIFVYSVEKAPVILLSATMKHYNAYSTVKGAPDDKICRVNAISTMLLSIGNAFEANFANNNSICQFACGSWKKAFEVCFSADLRLFTGSFPENMQFVEEEYKAKIKKYDTEYEPKTVIGSTRTKTLSACYIATAVYGSYDCPQVWTLRRFRDYKLSRKWYGRAFISLYYSISPIIIKWFGSTAWFNRFFKTFLDRMVASLKKQGFEDTPYYDRMF